VLWLWGHEHRLAIYREAAKEEEGDVTSYGRRIGGMPVELANVNRRRIFDPTRINM
jgi:hypothetical protein